MAKVYLIIGSNLGDRLNYFLRAKEMLQSIAGKITRESSLYETEPWGFVHENPFLNQVILLETELSPEMLLAEIIRIELSLGRIKGNERYTARCIDIDILFYDKQVIHSPDLVIPHTEISNRRFVLEPLSELCPALVHPVLNLTCQKLLSICNDTCKVTRMELL